MGRIIRVDGSEEGCPYQRNIGELIGSRTGLVDTVVLRHLSKMNDPLSMQVMLVDDTAYNDDRPINPKATALYHANCVPGTTYPICGDVWVGYDHEAPSS